MTTYIIFGVLLGILLGIGLSALAFVKWVVPAMEDAQEITSILRSDLQIGKKKG